MKFDSLSGISMLRESCSDIRLKEFFIDSETVMRSIVSNIKLQISRRWEEIFSGAVLPHQEKKEVFFIVLEASSCIAIISNKLEYSNFEERMNSLTKNVVGRIGGSGPFHFKSASM